MEWPQQLCTNASNDHQDTWGIETCNITNGQSIMEAEQEQELIEIALRQSLAESNGNAKQQAMGYENQFHCYQDYERSANAAENARNDLVHEDEQERELMEAAMRLSMMEIAPQTQVSAPSAHVLSEEEQEREMIERAIRASLEEEDNQKWPFRFGTATNHQVRRGTSLGSSQYKQESTTTETPMERAQSCPTNRSSYSTEDDLDSLQVLQDRNHLNAKSEINPATKQYNPSSPKDDDFHVMQVVEERARAAAGSAQGHFDHEVDLHSNIKDGDKVQSRGGPSHGAYSEAPGQDTRRVDGLSLTLVGLASNRPESPLG